MQSKSQIKYIFQNKENPWKIKKILKFNKKKWSISKRLLKKSIRNVFCNIAAINIPKHDIKNNIRLPFLSIKYVANITLKSYSVLILEGLT